MWKRYLNEIKFIINHDIDINYLDYDVDKNIEIIKLLLSCDINLNNNSKDFKLLYDDYDE